MPNPELVTLPGNSDVLREASHMANIARFLHLWKHARALVGTYGTYTTIRDTTVFRSASAPRSRSSTAEPSDTEIFLSLDAAETAINSAQPDGAAKDDLHFFNSLWETTIAVLEDILAHGPLPQELFGWGIFALSTGYLYSPCDRGIFSNHKHRLRSALKMMPSLHGRRRNEYVISGSICIEMHVKAMKEIHTVGHILLSRFRQDGWKKVRWYHATRVAERWIQALGLVPEERVEKANEMGSEDQEARSAFTFP
ncbi:hypothetical protein Ptr902_00942 [Pyrenophora tritici-repentis]|nr:hypothetical protein Ptr902_00942 [Pyrenophora tritici-repentis]